MNIALVEDEPFISGCFNTTPQNTARLFASLYYNFHQRPTAFYLSRHKTSFLEDKRTDTSSR
ncbi:MAG: hypothetical protein IGNPGNKH_00515 [Sodalis sp. Ffu]|nr:MAG: hypothetical protein IGNPGNKH_00515 [Sodalis sp. Ffu]